MSVDTQNPGSFPLAELIELLDEEWKATLVHPNGTLNMSGLQSCIDANKKIPNAFLQGFKAKYPAFRFPSTTPDPAPDAQIPVIAAPNDGDDDLISRKRKFTWFLHEWAGNEDELNSREADGTLKKLQNYTGHSEGEKLYTAADLAALEDLKNMLFEETGDAYYDHEKIALGSLSKSEYMLVPSDYELEECPIEMVGARSEGSKVAIPTIAAVYALAKQQAKDLKFSDDDQVKWALLRSEAFKFGWFANQKYTMRKPAPIGSMEIMHQDSKRIMELSDNAYALCSFLPFMAEYHFRAYGASYNKSNSIQYLPRAYNLATLASLANCLAYMHDQDNLHRKVLNWIGVKRPMQVLRNTTAVARVPSPFQTRAYWGPAGQAIITNSIAVIDSIKAAGWWDVIKTEKGYDDSALVSVGREVAKNPWKYHLMQNVYGESAPDGDEATQIEEAKRSAILFAPILQAYASTVMKKTPLAKITALKRHADVNMPLYKVAQQIFTRVSKVKSTTKRLELLAKEFRVSKVELNTELLAKVFRITDDSSGSW